MGRDTRAFVRLSHPLTNHEIFQIVTAVVEDITGHQRTEWAKGRQPHKLSARSLFALLARDHYGICEELVRSELETDLDFNTHEQLALATGMAKLYQALLIYKGTL